MLNLANTQNREISKAYEKYKIHLTNIMLNFNTTKATNELKEFIWFYFNCDTRSTCLKRLLESYSQTFKQEIQFKNLVISQQARHKTHKLIKFEEKYLEIVTYKEHLSEYANFLEENLSKINKPHLNYIITSATFQFLLIIENVIQHENKDCITKLSLYDFDKKQMLKEDFIINSFYLHALIFKCNSFTDNGDIFMSSQFNMNNFYMLKLDLYEQFTCLNLVDLNTNIIEKKLELEEMFKDYLVLPQNHLLLIYEEYFEIINLNTSKIVKVKVSSTTSSVPVAIISFCSNLDKTNVLINHEAAVTSCCYFAFLLNDFSLKIFQIKFLLNNSSQLFEIKLRLEKAIKPNLNSELVKYYELKVDRSVLINSFKNEMKFYWKSNEIKFRLALVVNFKLYMCSLSKGENEKDAQEQSQFQCFDLSSFCLVKNNSCQIKLIDFYENLILVMIESRIYCFCLGNNIYI